MSKKSILSTLLISSALLGTISASAATSAVKPEKKLVTITNKNAKIYKNSKLQESKKAKVGTVYKVNGFRTINKKHYYRVYQQDTKGKNVYKGYILDKDAKDLKGQAPAKADRFVGVTAEKAPAWKNLYFNIKMKTYNGEKHSSNFEVKTTYTINGKKYASLYRGEQWMGYMDAKNLKTLTPKAVAEDKQKYEVEKDYKTYNDIYFTEKGKLEKGTEVTVKRIYTFATGREYGSVYNKDGKWLGYVNMKALKAVEASNPSEPDKPTNPDKPEKPDTKPDQPGTGGDTSKPETPEQKLDKEIAKVKETAKKVYLTKAQEDKLNDVLAKLEKVTSKDEANFKKAQEVVAKAEKDLASQPNEKDGKALDTALKEYADFDKAKDHLTGFDVVKSAKENADKVMAELKKDAAKENKATVELTGKQVQEATKALEDAFSKVKIKTDNLKKAIEDAKKAIEGKHISADDKAKVDAAIKKAEEAVKNDTLSEKNLKDILDSEKAMQEIIDKAKDIAEDKDLVALKDAVAKVSEIDKHQDVKDMISTKYNDFTTIKKDFADAKAIVEGKKTTTKAEADKLAKDLIAEAKGLKLKKGTMENNIKYAEDVLKKKDQYLPEGVANVEKAIKDAKEALAKNTLENYTDFKQKSEAVLKAPSELKKNATTNKDSLQKILDDVKKLESIKDDIASNGTKVKEAYNKADELNKKIKDNNEEAKKTSASEVDAAKRGLETSVDGLKLNHKRLNDAIKTLTEDEKGHYLSEAQKSEAKEKLQSLVDAAKKATTVKEYDAYKKAVDALVKADKEMKKAPSAIAVKAIEKEYQQIKEKCATWEEGKHKEVFSPETEKPFEDALKAIEKVGKAVEANGEVTKEDLAEAEKAPQAAHNLKFNADLIDKKVNKPAEKLVKAAETLGNDYAKTDSNQTNLTARIQKAEEALGLQSAAETSEEEVKLPNVVAIRDDHWHVNGWEAIKSAEDEVVKSGKNLQKALKKPLEEEKAKGEKALETAVESKKEALRNAINTAEDDLNNNRYEKFAEDKKVIVAAIKDAGTNGSTEAKTLQETINKVDKIKTVPSEDFAKSSFDNIKAVYAEAQKMVKNPTEYTAKQVSDKDAELKKVAKGLKLNIDKIKKEGNQFKNMVGATGDGGTYYIDSTQKSQLTSQKSAESASKTEKLADIYNGGIAATTVDKYDAYNKADKTLTGAISKVEDTCPKMESVREVRSFVKELKDAGITDVTAKEHQDFFEQGQVKTLQGDLQSVKKVADAVKSKSPISKNEVGDGLAAKVAFLSLTMNTTGITKINAEVLEYEKKAYEASSSLEKEKSQREEIKNAVKALNTALESANAELSTEDVKIVKEKSQKSESTYKWNTEGITKVATAENTVKTKLKELVQKVTAADLSSTVQLGEEIKKAWPDVEKTTLPEVDTDGTDDSSSSVDSSEENVITKDEDILENTPKLARTIMDSPKASGEAKKLAEIVDAGYKVDKNSTGNEDQSISKIDNNLGWQQFGANGHGSYYDALGDLQNYARNTASVTKEKLQKDAEELVDDMEDLRVLPDYLDKAMKEAQKAEAGAKSAHVEGSEVETTEGLIADAKVIVEGKNDARRKLDNWDYINQLTAKLKEAAKKLTTIVKK